MNVQWSTLNDSQKQVYATTFAFLNGRLQEKDTVEWALNLDPTKGAERLALQDYLDRHNAKGLAEPWYSAWRIIEESWSYGSTPQYGNTDEYLIKERLKSGDRSGSIVNRIVELVEPKIKVEPFSGLYRDQVKTKKKPKHLRDLFSISVTSVNLISPVEMGIDALEDSSFLSALASSLEAAIEKIHHIAKRLDWNVKASPWRLGQVYRVYFVENSARSGDEDEPDAYHHGIAPSIKLLYGAVYRLLQTDPSSTVPYQVKWRHSSFPVFVRLWAALSRQAEFAPADVVAKFLLSLDDEYFWETEKYPEIAELRAVRFKEFDVADQNLIAKRIIHLPPRNLWRKNLSKDAIENARKYLASRELRRIELSEAIVPHFASTWLEKAKSTYADLADMSIEHGFLKSHKAFWVKPNPDKIYDSLKGKERLSALEDALKNQRNSWNDDPSQHALDWIRNNGNIGLLISDFESCTKISLDFPAVWDAFGWQHGSNQSDTASTAASHSHSEAERVLSLLHLINLTTLESAIDGIAHWMSRWKSEVCTENQGIELWYKMWPIAVSITNEKYDKDSALQIDKNLEEDGQQLSTAALNSPVGNLIDVFLAYCPNLNVTARPFEEIRSLKKMRDMTQLAYGRSALIVKFRFMQRLGYFMRADSQWATDFLIQPLLSKNEESYLLWRATTYIRWMTKDVLEIIGYEMASCAVDTIFDRRSRESFAFRIIIDCLQSYRNDTSPAVSHPRITQMIRQLDDEVRADAAGAIQRFVHDVSQSKSADSSPSSAEELFYKCAKRFLLDVWPQERSLATPGVSRSLADLPATSKNAFSDAVKTIERFIVPFDCWSMLDFGLYGDEDGKQKLSLIDDSRKASSLLHLLDLSIGTAEGSIIPHDLADALDHLRKLSISLENTRVFRRLATLARRV